MVIGGKLADVCSDLCTGFEIWQSGLRAARSTTRCSRPLTTRRRASAASVSRSRGPVAQMPDLGSERRRMQRRLMLWQGRCMSAEERGERRTKVVVNYRSIRAS
jgi:hypothetical protein